MQIIWMLRKKTIIQITMAKNVTIEMLDEMRKHRFCELDLEKGIVKSITEDEFRAADHAFDAVQYLVGQMLEEKDLNNERIAKVPGWLALCDKLTNEGEDSSTDYEGD